MKISFVLLALCKASGEDADVMCALQGRESTKLLGTVAGSKCVPVFVGQVAPIAGVFSSGDGSIVKQVVERGEQASTVGEFCIDQATAALLQRSFSISNVAGMEQVVAAKDATTEATPGKVTEETVKRKRGGCEVTGSGEKVSQTMDLSSYTKIKVGMAIEANVVVGDNYAFSINTYKNLLDYLDIQVKDDTLQLSFKKGTCNTNGTATAQVTVPAALVSAALQGASKMVIDRVDGPVSVVGASHFTASVISEGPVMSSGASHVTINKISPTTTSLTVSAEGASQVTFEDVVVSQATFSVSGASSVTGGNIETLTLDASGTSEVDTTVSSKASGSCSGAASITIRGGADTTGISSTGGCEVQAV